MPEISHLTMHLFYQSLYVATLVMHVLPMNYVLAGSAYLALISFRERIVGNAAHRGDGETESHFVAILRDWMPFALGITITAGVAPLLFIQILYKLSFYTANLLLFHRWMAILPVLIVAFYLLYLQKSAWFQRRSSTLQAAVAVSILAALGFVAWSWTENHLLALSNQETWRQQFAEGPWFFRDLQLGPRLALWCLGAFPTLAVILAWQSQRENRGAGEIAHLALLAVAGLLGAATAMMVYAACLPGPIFSGMSGATELFLLATTFLAGALQLALWGWAWRDAHLSASRLAVLTACVLVATTSMTVLRERLRQVSLTASGLWQSQYEAAQESFRWQGLSVFVVFFVLNTGLLVAIVYWLKQDHGPA